MKKTLHIDDQLLREAKSVVGAKTDTDTVRLGLEALIRRAAYERLRALRGSEPHARDIRDGVNGLPRPGIPRHERPGRHVRLDSVPVEPSTIREQAGWPLRRDEVSGHDFVYGELLIGDKGGRKALLAEYKHMDQALIVPHPDVVAFVRDRKLHGRGIGWIDVHLLASALVLDRTVDD